MNESGLKKLRKGDHEWWNSFYREAWATVFGFVLKKLTFVEAAEDITNLSFEKAYKHRETFSGRAKPLTWVCGIAKKEISRYSRERQRLRRHIERTTPLPNEWEPGETDEEIVQLALRRLRNDRQTEILIRKHKLGESKEEIRREMRLSHSAYRQLLYRATIALREAVKELL